MISPNERFDGAAVTLLDNLHHWRLRAVERIELSKAGWSEREREIHVPPLNEVMARNVDLREDLLPLSYRMAGATIDVVLPITEFPKIPLLDLEITVAGKQVPRLSRDETARIQARYILKLADRSGISRNPSPDFVNLLTFIFYSPPTPWQKVWARHKRHWEFVRGGNKHQFISTKEMPYAQLAYLKAQNRKFGDDLDVQACYHEWLNCVQGIPELARGRIIHDPMSGSLYPLITLPYFYQEMRSRVKQGNAAKVPSAVEMTELLKELNSLLSQASGEAHRNPDAGELISAYFAYGYRWTAMARCKVPLNESFVITTKAKRAIYFTPYTQKKPSLSERLYKKEAWQMIPFSDAETNHVSIRIGDTAVQFGHTPKVYDENLKPLPDYVEEEVEEEAGTFELYFRQDSSMPEEGKRKKRIYICCPLRLTAIHSGMLNLSIIVTGFAILLLLNRGLGDVFPTTRPPGEDTPQVANGLTAKDATLILVPVSFVASFLLIRDTSTLSAWLREIRQRILLGELCILLLTTFILLSAHHFRIG